MKSFISGCHGPVLTNDEQAFFRHEKPCGLILFDRNCETPDQVRKLIDDFVEAVEVDKLLILVDQEGGRVRRLKPPGWQDFPPGAAFGRLYQRDTAAGLEAAYLGARILSDELRENGFTVNCVPVLDIPVDGAHDIISDRAYGSDVETVVALAKAVARGHLDGGVLPVIKHIPGHGRADVDSHQSLPVINASKNDLEKVDFAPFRALNDLPLAMTGHVLIPEYDKVRPVSTSSVIITEVIRRSIGFDGLLMSDDLGMGALEGDMASRSADVMAAGCDLALYCKGEIEDMQAVAANVPALTGKAKHRFKTAIDLLEIGKSYDKARARTLLKEVFSLC